MQEYLILNEESLPFESSIDADKNLSEFFFVFKKAFKERVSPIRVSEKFDSNWYNVLLSNNYFFRDWIQKQEKEYSISIKTLISKTTIPQIPIDDLKSISQFKLSEFCVFANNHIKTPSLGASFILDAISISFLTDSIWDSFNIALLWTSLDEHDEIQEKECSVKNIARVKHWEKYFNEIQDQRKENLKKGRLFWENREKEFSELIFCKDSKKQFTSLSIGNSNYNRLWDNLKLLNNNIAVCNSDRELKEKTKLNFSDESDSVKKNNKLKRYREFVLPDKGTKEFFGLHVKNFPGAFRLHFFPDYTKKKIYIGYFGKHLPL